ncbi:MAG: DnaJ domain-containing protein [Bacteroidota bacterium]|nr:DnaJ domain-containing protein [Bacteroidota bacterium]
MPDVQNRDLPKIIKRLQLIKSLISLEEEDEITTHVSKLEQFVLTPELIHLISYLKEKSYSKAVIAIEVFINQHHNLTVYSDPEIEGLKLEAKSLEAKLNKLSNEKADLEKLIHEFGVRHNKELGELILKILKFRKNKAKGTPKETEAEEDYKNYSQEFEVSKNEKIAELTDEELLEIKKKYRKASKLCHPDVVSEDQKELADKLFAELNAAYERNDLQKVTEILKNLEKGNFFVNKSDAINEKQLMKTEIEKLKIRIRELQQQMQLIKESDAYKTINSIKDWDSYFKETKEKLENQAKELESEESNTNY